VPLPPLPRGCQPVFKGLRQVEEMED